MKMLAYLLAIICIIAAVMYFVMPAGSLPTFMPGYESGSAHIHHKHDALVGAAADGFDLVAGLDAEGDGAALHARDFGGRSDL
jgi:hypothetical protein